MLSAGYVNRLWDFVEATNDCETLQGLQSVTANYAHAVGFNRYGFAQRSAAQFSDDNRFISFHNFPEAYGTLRYEKIYPTEKAIRDPLVTHLLAGLPPTAYDAKGVVTHTRHDIRLRSCRILEDARDFGINSGLFLPLSSNPTNWSFLVLTASDSNDAFEVIRALPELYTYARHFYCKLHLIANRRCESDPSLSKRETEILAWAAVGKTSWEIGVIAKISEGTVNFHLANAAKKLNVSGRRAACAKALLLGLITI